MHELSVAANIIDTIQHSVPAEVQCSIHSINIRLGMQAGVVCDSLLFLFDILKTDTRFKNACLCIEDVPFTIFCTTCDNSFLNDMGLLICPSCGGTDTRIVSGTELQIVDVELTTEDRDESRYH